MYDVAPRVEQNLTTAHKTVAAALTWLGTFAAEAVAAGLDANTWVQGALLVAGGAVNAAAVYLKKNWPKR